MTLTPLLLLLILCMFISTSGFMLNKNHLLVSLLFLESFMLATVLMFPIATTQTSSYLVHYSIILLSVGACEASMGLALMVMMSRTYGSDMMNMMSLNKC